MGLTSRQRVALGAFFRCRDRLGRNPMCPEVGREMGVTTEAAWQMMRRLLNQGVLEQPVVNRHGGYEPTELGVMENSR